jgi:Transglycosylase SLT domain
MKPLTMILLESDKTSPIGRLVTWSRTFRFRIAAWLKQRNPTGATQPLWYRPWVVGAAFVTTVIVISTAAYILAGSAPQRQSSVQRLSVHRVYASARTIRVAQVPKAVPQPAVIIYKPSVFGLEQQMSFAQLMKRWDPWIALAAKRFDVPENWIRAVMRIESGGRTMLGENQPITSSTGAMGLMQLMPQTYNDMRVQYRLGANAYDPHDNILAGAAYLRFLRAKYGYPNMFAAYNDGPGNLEARMVDGGLLPAETINYVATITGKLNGGGAGSRANLARFTRPNGEPVMIDGGAVISVRAALPGEYAPGVLTVIMVGKTRQGVREGLAQAKTIIRTHGGAV